MDHCKKGMALTLPGHPQPPDSESSTSSDDDNDEDTHKYLVLHFITCRFITCRYYILLPVGIAFLLPDGITFYYL